MTPATADSNQAIVAPRAGSQLQTEAAELPTTGRRLQCTEALLGPNRESFVSRPVPTGRQLRQGRYRRSRAGPRGRSAIRDGGLYLHSRVVFDYMLPTPTVAESGDSDTSLSRTRKSNGHGHVGTQHTPSPDLRVGYPLSTIHPAGVILTRTNDAPYQ